MTRRTITVLGLVGTLVVGGALAARATGIQPVRIVSNSMAPTAESGDWVVVKDVAAPGVEDIQRDEVVMFRYPPGGGPMRAIKRVVAVGGDRVEVGPRSVAVNGKVIRIGGAPSRKAARRRVEVVPPGRFFLLGDNATVSIDSRSFGAVAPADIMARRVLTAGSSRAVVMRAGGAVILLAAAILAAMVAVRARAERLG